jgi:branched-chain amino acid transport system substrate-binding protein
MSAKLLKRLGCLWVVIAFCLPCMALSQDEGVSDREIVIGQSLGLTGPLAELGVDIANGAKAYFDWVNSKGGIHGRKVRLVTLDDAYIPAKTAQNVLRLLDEERAFALLNIMGTPNSAAILPIVEQRGTVLFSPMTGAEIVRAPFRANVFNVRAGYRMEIEKLVQHLSTLSVKNVAVVAQANSFGKEGLASVETAMAGRGMKPLAVASLQTDAIDANAAAQKIAASRPSAIILVTAGKATFEFIRAYNRLARGAQFYTLSVMGAQSNIKALGADGVGTVVVSVVPFPWSLASPLAKEYRLAMSRNGHTDYSFVSFEAYINARVLGEALQRAGRELNRPKLIAAAEAMSGVNMGEFPVSFSRESRQGSQFVELTLIGANGRFVK